MLVGANGNLIKSEIIGKVSVLVQISETSKHSKLMIYFKQDLSTAIKTQKHRIPQHYCKTGDKVNYLLVGPDAYRAYWSSKRGDSQAFYV